MCCMQKLLQITKQYSFFKPVFNDLSKDVEFLKFGSAGELMSRNILNEWIYSNVISRDEPVFPFSSSQESSNNFLSELKEQFEHTSALYDGLLPFSIVNIRTEIKTDIKKTTAAESDYFKPKKQTKLIYTHFDNPSNGQRFFHYWQRQRKMWWRKFSADPGRFSLTEIQNDEVYIQAEFPWGTEQVEVVQNGNNEYFEKIPMDDRNLFKIKIGNKTDFPYVVQSTTNLECVLMVYLCDAFCEQDAISESVESRQFLSLHRKLAPYKTTVFAPIVNDAKIGEDLRLLCVYLTLNLRKAGICTFISPFVGKKSLEDQFSFCDSLGIPYTVIVTESTLSDGIFGFRNRETTIQEKLHVSQLTTYLEQILKTY